MKQEPVKEEEEALPSEEGEAVEAAEILGAMLGGAEQVFKEPPAKKRRVERSKRKVGSITSSTSSLLAAVAHC